MLQQCNKEGTNWIQITLRRKRSFPLGSINAR